jgi:hypothetical protein
MRNFEYHVFDHTLEIAVKLMREKVTIVFHEKCAGHMGEFNKLDHLLGEGKCWVNERIHQGVKHLSKETQSTVGVFLGWGELGVIKPAQVGYETQKLY